MNPDFWKNKTVLITGNTGFKGSWLTLWLSSLGARVIGYSLPPPTTPSHFELAEISRDAETVTGDIRDLKLLIDTFSRVQPEIVIHMAAQSLVRESYKRPGETYEINIMGTVNVLEAIRVTPGTRAAVFVTSDKCYENTESKRPYKESDPMGGHDPYSSSKGCSELVVSSYRKSFFPKKTFKTHGVALATVRAGNVIGGGDWSRDRLIVDAMKAFMRRETLVIRNPDAVRPWQHVLDPLYCYMILAEKLWEFGPKFASAWNIGPDINDAKPVSWVVDHLRRFWNNGSNWKKEKEGSPHEAKMLLLDASKARHELGWSPKLTIMPSLAWTVAWYRAFQRGTDMRAMSLKQISHYHQYLNPTVNNQTQTVAVP